MDGVYNEKSHLEMDDDWGYPHLWTPPYLDTSFWCSFSHFVDHDPGLDELTFICWKRAWNQQCCKRLLVIFVYIYWIIFSKNVFSWKCVQKNVTFHLFLWLKSPWPSQKNIHFVWPNINRIHPGGQGRSMGSVSTGAATCRSNRL